MLGFSPLIDEALAAVPAPASSPPSYGSSFETAPMGGVVLGSDGSTSTGTSTNILQSHPASGTIAVTVSSPTAGATKGAVATGSLSVTGDVTASGVFHVSTDAPSTTVFTVTVVSGKFYINGAMAPVLTLYEGNTYRFDQSHSSNSTHPLRFNTNASGTINSGSQYTTGVTTAGTAGNSGAYTEITVPDGGPPIFYYCVNHSGMGNFADTPTTITADITGTGFASRIAASDTASGDLAVTATATAISVEVVLLANVDITATGAAEAARVRGLDSTTGNDLVVTHDARTSAVFGAVGSGDVDATGTAVASRILGMVGSGTAAITGTALVLPDPTNYGNKSVVSSTTSAANTFTVSATTPVRVKYAVGTGDLVVTGTGTPTGVFSSQASGTAAITGTALHNAGQKYVLGSAAVSVTGSNPQILIRVRAFPQAATIAATVSSPVFIRHRQRDGNADAPVVTGTGDARRFRLVDGAGDVAATATSVASAVLGAQGTGDTAATVTATAIKIRIMSPASGSISVSETAEALRVRSVTGSATGAATGTATGIIFTLRLMDAASNISVTGVASPRRILPQIGATTISVIGTASSQATFSPSIDGRITCNSFALIFLPKLIPRTTAVVERYSRRVLPTGDLRDVMGNELQNIERTISSVTEAAILSADAEPETKRQGMVRYAVTPWDPLSNGTTGLVVYDGNTWSAV